MIEKSDINFHILVDKINVGIYVCDPKGAFIYANQALADIFGFGHPSMIIGKNFLDFMSPERGQKFMNQFQKSTVSGTNSTLITTEIIRSDGKSAQIEINTMPFFKKNILLGSQGVVQDITKRRQEEFKRMYTSTHDSLTGIYNRTFFEAELERLERGRQFPISIIVINLGFLKNFSVSEDHEGRDKLIKGVAHRLFYTFRGDDIVARIGGDEFAILFPKVDENTVDEIVKRIRGNLLEINKDKDKPVLDFYIGSSTANNGERLSAVLKQAEAMAHLEKKKADLNR